MKILTLFSLLIFSHIAFAQVVVGSAEYQNLKENNALVDSNLVYDPAVFSPAGLTPIITPPAPSSGNRAACDCYVQPDATYTLAMGPNDDGSSGIINIPFNFCFYGQTYTSFYINNNGNITFGSPLAGYSSTAFPSAINQIIAPFWGDVDTGAGNGQVLYKVTPTAVYINWESVGYYSQHGDKLNTFQLIITDGVDPVVESGNVAFCYEDMQWTTGDASSGVNGFGGIPATAGANKGDNVAYFLISQFDHPGVDFDGALGNPDGISWLDDKSFYFDVCNTGNIPPIPEGISSCDTFKVCSFGDTADISLSFLSPEANQLTSLTYTNGGLGTVQQITNLTGNVAELVLRVIGDPGSAGTYNLTVTATDNATPIAGTTTISFVVVIEDSPVVIDPVLDPLMGCDSVLATVLNGPYDTYLWDDLSNGSTNYINQSGPSGVTVSINGCYKRVVDTFTVATSPYFNLQGGLNVCPGLDANVFIPDSLNLDSITWYLPDPAIDSLYSQSFGVGTYSATIWDQTGLCFADTTFDVVVADTSIMFADQLICNGDLDYQVTGLGSNPSGVWSSGSTEISFSDPMVMNPLITATTPGEYTVSYADNCGTGGSASIIFAELPSVLFTDTSLCSLTLDITGTIAHSTGGFWNEPSGNVDFSPSVTNLNPTVSTTIPGIYNIVFTDSVCGNTASTEIEFIAPPQIFGDTLVCNYGMFVSNTVAYNGGIWTSMDTTINFTDSSLLNPGIGVTYPGTYTVTFTDNACNLSVSSEIEFPPYAWTEVRDTIVCVGTEIVLRANENWTVDNYVWSTGETGSSIVVSEPGIYTVTVSNICHSATEQAIVGNKLCDIQAPNIISLSSTSGNNIWFVDQEGISEYNCVIVNRWGNVIFETNDPAGAWDGRTPNGSLVEEGTYFYTIEAILDNGDPLDKHGFIQVIH